MCVVCARLCQVVRLYSVVEIVVMSGEVACCSVVCGTLVGVSVFSVMCSELLIMSQIIVVGVSNESGMLVTCRMQYAMYVSTVL